MELKLSKAPAVELDYGILQNELEWMSWTKGVLKTLVESLKQCSETDCEVFVEKTAEELFKEIINCGWKQGYEDASFDYSENGGFV